MSIVIATLENKNDANFVARFARKFNGSRVRVMNEEEMENRWMLKMIDEAENEGGEISEAEIMKTLKRNGTKIQTKV